MGSYIMGPRGGEEKEEGEEEEEEEEEEEDKEEEEEKNVFQETSLKLNLKVVTNFLRPCIYKMLTCCCRLDCQRLNHTKLLDAKTMPENLSYLEVPQTLMLQEVAP